MTVWLAITFHCSFIVLDENAKRSLFIPLQIAFLFYFLHYSCLDM